MFVFSKFFFGNKLTWIFNKQLKRDKFRAISDFISGMTDRYAIQLYNNIK